jgi:hypothetical protein
MSKLISEKEKTVLRLIGEYYLDKQFSTASSNEKSNPIFVNNCYFDCHKELAQLGIHAVSYTESKDATFDTITIFLERPGILIGVQGSNIKELHAYIEEEMKTKIKITVKEYDISQYLIPLNYMDMDLDYI